MFHFLDPRVENYCAHFVVARIVDLPLQRIIHSGKGTLADDDVVRVKTEVERQVLEQVAEEVEPACVELSRYATSPGAAIR